jgi:glycosyltransferase involved in cell wall biosynthesis
MHAEEGLSFAFLVLTYNHQEYILEHLESIKYLVVTYGDKIQVDIIVNDDCSKDQTCRLVDSWLQVNSYLFRHVKKIYNLENLGTCASVNNMLSHMLADRCKLTAGDDLYSFENLFELTNHDQDVAILSGRALYLVGNVLAVNRQSSFLATATQVIYHNESLLHRFKHLSYDNAPNIHYSRECLMHPIVRAHLQKHDVTEDWALQIAIARQFPRRKFKLIDKVLVYYRRTAGSSYIVANERFRKDKILIYEDLIKHESNWFERFRLLSRKACFGLKCRPVSKIVNLDLYLFFVACLFNFFKITAKYKKIYIPQGEHRSHYARIKDRAKYQKMAMDKLL